MIKIDGRFWLNKNGESFLGNGRIELLEKIDRVGSMHAAAKEMKMSYKAAWDRLNSMNELADEPLINRTVGGKGGGGTKLTPYARELIKTYKRLSELHRQFIDRFSEAGDDPEHLARILSRTFLTTSARNQLPSIINNIELNTLYAQIDMKIAGGAEISSRITTKSVKNMGLKVGADIYGIIKSSDIIVTNEPPKQNDNINILEGTIRLIEMSEHSVEISFEVNPLTTLIALMSKEDVDSLKIGSSAFAIINKNHIIIGS